MVTLTRAAESNACHMLSKWQLVNLYNGVLAAATTWFHQYGAAVMLVMLGCKRSLYGRSDKAADSEFPLGISGALHLFESAQGFKSHG
ncbi:hypothetical protein AK812_SmicGene14217 [Symbiodinium microadriaticum]|uniref:Uncharacterized protein n=1 Tax=Symbiodinium microadriaticum TaxID=2951 RepID=A0A1Q9E633_SYMMI|nr:hypothetical protein AK812_SmicGene14217 [Symbiodinium microadriaticum]